MGNPIDDVSKMLGINAGQLQYRAAHSRGTEDRQTVRVVDETPDLVAISTNLDYAHRKDTARNIVAAGGDADEPYAEDHDCSGIARSVNSMRKKLDENDKGYVKKGDKNPDGNPDRSEQDDDAKSLDAKSTHEDEDGDNDGEDIDAKVKTLTARMCEACASAYKMRGASNDLTGVCGECKGVARKAMRLESQRRSAHSRSYLYAV